MKKLDVKVVWLFFLRSALHSLFFIIFISLWLSVFMVGTVGTFVYTSISTPILIFIGLVVWLAMCYLWAQLTYNFYGYELTDIGFKKESGVITKKYITIPYDRIQNVDINRGIISRILGLSDVFVQTAGSSAMTGRYGSAGMVAEGYLPGLSKEVAEKLRDELINRAKNSKNQGV